MHFHVNAEAAELAELLATSSLFWHATGYGEQTRRHPERLEHFGIATAEAMLCGAVPLVVPAGGQPEIVTDNVNGRHWTTVPELVAGTQELIEHPDQAEKLRRAAQQRAKTYSKRAFSPPSASTYCSPRCNDHTRARTPMPPTSLPEPDQRRRAAGAMRRGSGSGRRFG